MPKAAKKKTPTTNAANADDIAARRAKAYADMEPHLCDLARMSEIAAMMFDKAEGLFVFATTHLDEMFGRRYYALDFPL
jgi:hypothetical protein